MVSKFQTPDSAAQIISIPVLALELMISILMVPLLAVQLALSIVTVPFVMAQMTTSVLGQAAGRMDGYVGNAANAKDHHDGTTISSPHSSRLSDPYDSWRPPVPPVPSDQMRREPNGQVRTGV